MTRERLLGDFFGMKSKLAERGIVTDFILGNYYQGVTTGGNEQTFEYGGKLDMYFDFQGAKFGLNEGFNVILHAETRWGSDILSAAVRVALGRSIVQSVAGTRPELPVLTLEPELERILNESAQEGGTIGLEPAMVERLHKSLSDRAQSQEVAGEPAVLLVAPQVRPWMSRMMRNIRNLTVLAYNEIPDDKRINMIAAVS